MSIYIIGTIISVFFAYLSFSKKEPFKKKDKYQVTAIILSATPLILIAGLRYKVGTDYEWIYQKFFENLLIGVVDVHFEIGFYYLNKVIQIFTDDYMWIFMVTSILFIYFSYKGIYKESPDPSMSVFLLIATQSYFAFLNGVRQYIVLAIFLFSIKYIRERKLWSYMISIILASTIHSIALIFIPVYFLYNIKIKPKWGTFLLVAIVVLNELFRNILYQILLNTKYIVYINHNYSVQSGGYITLLIELAILIFSWLYYDEDKKYNFFCNLQLISVILAFFHFTIPLIYRVRWCFNFSAIVLIPLILDNIKNQKNKKILKYLIIVLYSVYIIYTIGIKNAHDVLPYLSIFER